MANEEISTLRNEIAELRNRLERNEDLLDKTIGALALTSGATETLLKVIIQFHPDKDGGRAHAIGMPVRGIFSAMGGAINNLRSIVEKSKGA